MKLEERQSALENEMNTAKDTIWRLTNRIFNLESEVGKLKQVLRVASAKSILGNASSSKIASAKLAEIARRRQKTGYKYADRPRQRSAKHSATANSIANSHDEVAVDNIEVKQEPISDVEENDAENVQPNTSESFLSMSSHNMSTRGAKVNVKMDDLGSESSGGSESSDYGSDEDYVTPGFSALRRKSTSSTGNRLSVGRPIGSVWKHFKRVALKTEDGTAVMRAICRYCKQAVSPRSDRLKPHIQKCRANDRKESISAIRTAKYTPRKMERPTKFNAVPKMEVIKMDTSSNAFGSSDEEAEETSYNVNRSSLMRGRKKGPIWAYYDETWITMTDGEKRGIAVCKKCKKHLDKKTDRLRSHLKKCSPDVLLNDSGRPTPTTPTINESPAENIPTHPIVSQSTTAPESKVDSDIVAEGEIIVAEGEITKPINTASEVETSKSDTGEESDLETIFSLTEVISGGDGFTEAGDSNGIVGVTQGEQKRNPVWENFRIVAIVGTESSNGAPNHTAFCNKCNKEVNPKTHRLQSHFNKCSGANTTT